MTGFRVTKPGKYLNRKGEIKEVTQVQVERGHIYPVLDSTDGWTIKGRFYVDRESDLDLVAGPILDNSDFVESEEPEREVEFEVTTPGKYRCRNGEIREVARINEMYAFSARGKSPDDTWKPNGRRYDDNEHDLDLVAGPILDNSDFVESEEPKQEPEPSVDTLPDSGDRTQFETGAVRDASSGKGLPSCIPPIAIRKLAKRFEDGAKKYALHNWMQGVPLSRFQDAITRHTLAWAEGDTSEDHLGAVLWNASVAAWTEQEIEAGRLPKDLDDLPFRK